MKSFDLHANKITSDDVQASEFVCEFLRWQRNECQFAFEIFEYSERERDCSSD